MSDSPGLMRRLIAGIRALLTKDWRGPAGIRFNKTVTTMSHFADEHKVRPSDLAHESVELARTALHGKANKDLAAAVKDFADAEDTKIETELKRRSLETEVQKKEAEVRKTEAEARKTEAEAQRVQMDILSAELELFKKIKELGVILRSDEHGNLTIFPAPMEFDFERLQKPLIDENDPNQ